MVNVWCIYIYHQSCVQAKKRVTHEIFFFVGAHVKGVDILNLTHPMVFGWI